jgi:hypothetical protein
MRTTRISRSDSAEFVVAFKVFVQPNGSMVVIMGNQKLEITQDGIHALLCGTLDYARVFATLHREIDETLETINESSEARPEWNSRVNGHEV